MKIFELANPFRIKLNSRFKFKSNLEALQVPISVLLTFDITDKIWCNLCVIFVKLYQSLIGKILCSLRLSYLMKSVC